MRGLSQLCATQVRLFLREPAAAFFTLAFPSLLLIVFGSVFGNQPMTQWGLEFGYVDLQVPALAAIIIGNVGLVGIPVATATARESGYLRRLRATPLRPVTWITADVLVNLAMSALGMIVLILLAKVLFGLRFAGSWAVVSLAFVFAALAIFAMGYLLAGLAGTARIAQTVGMAFFFPMMFLSGAALPRQVMPSAVQRVADFLPLTHLVAMLQSAWAGDGLGPRQPAVLWLAATLVVSTALAVRLFRWE